MLLGNPNNATNIVGKLSIIYDNAYEVMILTTAELKKLEKYKTKMGTHI